MKKLLVILFILFAVSVNAETVRFWHTADSKGIAWDPVLINSAGTPLPTGEEVRYNIFIMDVKNPNPLMIQENWKDTSILITFSLEASYIFGVQSTRWLLADPADPEDFDAQVSESTISWTNNPDVCYNGETFGVRYFLPPGQAKGLRRQ